MSRLPFFTRNNLLILLAALFLMATGNFALFSRLAAIFPPGHGNLLLLCSLAVFFTCLTSLLLLWLNHGRASRWTLALIVLLAAMAAYFMDKFGVVMDVVMLDNIAQTNVHEAAGLMSSSFILRTVLLGLLPAGLILRFAPKPERPLIELKSKLLLSLALLAVLAVAILPFSAHYASFIREHKTTRFYANPNYFIYSLAKYLPDQLKSVASGPLVATATDTVEEDANHPRKELVILVVGETARADRFSLNGYHRLTNPLLAKEDVVSLSNVSSCGTSTGESVPCMFSVLKRKEFDREKAAHYQNILDVLNEHGVEVLWRDNNSDSKGVATRVTYEDFKTPTLNPDCDTECRDTGMLHGLDQYIAERKGKDILIVLHQMGNHGPEYYRRYPKAFERFTPVCRNSDLGSCTREEIDNAYDNAILYTDYFLDQVIQLLKKHDDEYATAMLYVSDHGESLGEHGIYLHAAPYMIAPKEQTHIPAIIWMGKHFDYTLDQLKPYRDQPFSHDDLFCTLMVTYELKSKTCESENQVMRHNMEVISTTK
ncbi:MAG TPA: phosphoethanolamine--lipid A transferase [Methylophilaceae bacterium]|nr:phosphoethanolamine--lipid A transferase [Methylophilaceae bacterium]